jgi:hypothetical protein
MGSSGGYRGPQVRIPGIFVTPVSGAPFAAVVNIVSHQRLPDGTEHAVTTINHVARTSSGRIYNERRQLRPLGAPADPKNPEPALLGSHIYDPSSRLNIFLDPFSRLAREQVLEHPSATLPGPTVVGPKIPGTVESALGTQTLDGVELQGLRRVRTLPATASGTGKEITITDDFWYSPALSVYLIIRHDDPRTGEQLVAVTHIQRGEPDAALFAVPPSYRVVDETPEPLPTQP